MKTSIFGAAYWKVGTVIWTACVMAVAAGAGNCANGQTLAVRAEASAGSPAGGNGDSWTPITTPDGRYVVFASTANNLVGDSAPEPLQKCINVYLRDRVAGTTRLASVSTNGTGANGDLQWTNISPSSGYVFVPSAAANSVPAGITADGRYVLFTSTAGTLVTNDTNHCADVFVRDMQENVTTLVSVNDKGVSRKAPSRNPVMSGDGRYVAFACTETYGFSVMTRYVGTVFVRDLVTKTTVLVSTPSGQPVEPRGDSDFPAISADGRYVAFCSVDTNLVSGLSGKGDVFVRDLVSNTTTWVSAGGRTALPATIRTTAVCATPMISADGNFISYSAGASSNSTAGYVFRYSLLTGQTDVVCTNAVIMINSFDDDYGHSIDLSSDGRRVAFISSWNGSSSTFAVNVWDAATGTSTLASGNLSNSVLAGTTVARPLFNQTGELLAFLSNASDLATNSVPGARNIYVRDLVNNSTALINADTNGGWASCGWQSSYCFGGDRVMYDAQDGGSVNNDVNRCSDVFSADLSGGQKQMISVHAPGLQFTTPYGFSIFGSGATSANGRYLAFVTDASNLGPNDFNRCRDVYVHDFVSNSNVLISVNTNGESASAPSSEPSISADGRYVAFTSAASDVSGMPGRYSQVYVRDTKLGTTVCGSADLSSLLPKSNWYSPQVSDDGRRVMMRCSEASANYESLYIRDLQDLQPYCVTSRGVSAAQMTPDGHYVAYCVGGWIRVWDCAKRSGIISMTGSTTNLAIAADGSSFAVDRGALSIFRIPSGTPVVLDTNLVNPKSFCFSADGSALVTTAGPVGDRKVYWCSVQTGQTKVISHEPYDLVVQGGRMVEQSSISPDGRFVAYASISSSSGLSLRSNALAMIVVRDLAMGNETVYSPDKHGARFEYSRNLSFSRNGNWLLFQSSASDLVPGDFNRSEDIFVLPYYSSVDFDRSRYVPGDTAVISLTAPAVDLNQPSQQSVSVNVQSDLDPVGIELTLTKTATNTGVFTSSASGKNLVFTDGPSDNFAKLIKAKEGAWFWVVFSDAQTGLCLTNYAMFSTNPPPVIVVQPTGTNILRYGTASFRVEANSAVPISFQWYCDGVAVPGATENVLVITNAEIGGRYTVRVSSYSGSATSQVAALGVGDPPLIVRQPVSLYMCADCTSPLSARAEGSNPMFVQWWRKTPTEQPITGWNAYGNPAEFQSPWLGPRGFYFAVVSNAFGVVTSDVAEVRITGDPPMLRQPQILEHAFHLSIACQPGIIYELLESTNLVDWTTNQVIEWATPDQTVTLPLRTEKVFYRLKAQ